MTIGTYTFYTITRHFAIDICGFFQIFFEFIMNFALILLKSTKRNKIFMCQSLILGFSSARIFLLFSSKSAQIFCVLLLSTDKSPLFSQSLRSSKKRKTKAVFFPNHEQLPHGKSNFHQMYRKKSHIIISKKGQKPRKNASFPPLS